MKEFIMIQKTVQITIKMLIMVLIQKTVAIFFKTRIEKIIETISTKVFSKIIHFGVHYSIQLARRQEIIKKVAVYLKRKFLQNEKKWQRF